MSQEVAASGAGGTVGKSDASAAAAPIVVVDRTLHPLLTTQQQQPSITPSSSSSSVSPATERLHRLHGTSLIQSACALLGLSPSCTATACTIFHRLYHRMSLRDMDVWSASMGCVLLASKVEECPRRIREIITVFVHLYRRRRLEVGWDRGGTTSNDDNNTDGKKRRRLTDEEKLNLLRYQHPLMPNSRLYKEWSEALTKAETEILRQLGFTLYWIPDHHPHKFILYFVRVLGLDGDDSNGGSSSGDGAAENNANGDGNDINVTQRAWNYCNDASLLDLSVRYEPEIVACAAILLATTNAPGGEAQHALPMAPRPWWEVFVGPGRGDDLVAVCNAILALQDSSDSDGGNPSVESNWGQMLQAMRGFVPSLVDGGSFNDPGSFVWDTLEDAVV